MIRGRNEATWRRRTARFAAATIAVGALLALLPFAAPALFGTWRILGLPAAAFLGTIGMPAAILVIAALFVGRQLAIDRRHDVAER